MEYDKCTFMCVLLCFVSLPSIVFTQRNCPPGKFCQIGANCTSDTSFCVSRCPTERDHHQQGNYLTGNCERLPNGTEHWMDSTFYEIFILSNQTLNSPILTISFISTDAFQTGNMSFENLPNDITFTLIGSCPYFYFTNMMKEVVRFENYYDLYVPDDVESASLALAEPVSPDDYEMEVIVTDSGNVLERRDIIVHVRDVPPCTAGPETFVDISSSSFNVSKSAGKLVVTLISLKALSQSFIVGIIAEADNSSVFPAATATEDFTPGRYNATFSTGATTATATIPLIIGGNDTDIKLFSLRLFIDGAVYQQCIFPGNVFKAAVFVIPVVVEFASGQFVGSESSGFIEVIVRITGGFSITPIIVTITPSVQSPVSAMGSGVDFNSDPFNITINAGATDSRANVSVTCDDEVEGLETFNMRLIIASDNSEVTLGRNTCEGQINDSTVAVNFNQSSYEIAEDDGTVNIMIILSKPSLVPFQAMLVLTDITAVAGEDYIYNRNQITVDAPPGVASQSLTINIFDDNIVECIEKFNVTLISVTTCGVTIGSNRISEVTIRDDDGAKVSLKQSQYSVIESENLLTVFITLSKITFQDVIVEVTITDGSANAGGDNAISTAQAFNVTISAGSTSSSFNIYIINDMIRGDNQTFNIAIRLLPSCLSLSLGISSSTVTIIDDDDEICLITMIHGTIDHDQNRNATIFEFSSDGDPKAKYTCKLDNDKFNDCRSPIEWTNLRRGKHSITVRAVCPDDEGKQLTILHARRKFNFKIR